MLVRRQEARVCQRNQRSAPSQGTIPTTRGPQRRADIHRTALYRAPPIRRREQEYPPVLGFGIPVAEMKLGVVRFDFLA